MCRGILDLFERVTTRNGHVQNTIGHQLPQLCIERLDLRRG